MLNETYTCDICGAPEITPAREVGLQIRQFRVQSVGPCDTLHVCGDCASRWPKGEGFFDWLRGRIKISEVVGR